MGDCFYQVLALGEELRSPYKGTQLQPSTGQKSCTHGSRNIFQYWGWGLGVKPPKHFQTPVLHWISFSLRVTKDSTSQHWRCIKICLPLHLQQRCFLGTPRITNRRSLAITTCEVWLARNFHSCNFRPCDRKQCSHAASGRACKQYDRNAEFHKNMAYEAQKSGIRTPTIVPSEPTYCGWGGWCSLYVYIYIYVYMRCRVNIWFKNCLFSAHIWSKFCVFFFFFLMLTNSLLSARRMR